MAKPKSEDAPRLPQPLRFSWHAEPPNSFLKWLIPTVLSRVAQSGEFEIYSQATSRFNDVELTLFINGIPVDTEAFLEGVERNMNHAVAVEALRILQERTSLDAFQSAVDAAVQTFMQQLKAAGLELPDKED